MKELFIMKNFLIILMIMGVGAVLLGAGLIASKQPDYMVGGCITFFAGCALILCSALVQKFRTGGESDVVPQIKYLESSERNY